MVTLLAFQLDMVMEGKTFQLSRVSRNCFVSEVAFAERSTDQVYLRLCRRHSSVAKALEVISVELFLSLPADALECRED